MRALSLSLFFHTTLLRQHYRYMPFIFACASYCCLHSHLFIVLFNVWQHNYKELCWIFIFSNVFLLMIHFNYWNMLFSGTRHDNHFRFIWLLILVSSSQSSDASVWIMDVTLNILHLAMVKNILSEHVTKTEKRFKWWKWNEKKKKEKSEIQTLIFEMLIVERLTIIENEYVIYLNIAINMLPSNLLFAAFFIQSFNGEDICSTAMYVNVSIFIIVNAAFKIFIWFSRTECNAIIIC